MEKISCVICTFNEEARIAKVINSVKGVSEIVIADDGSTDKTKEIAESLGAKVFRRKDHKESPTLDLILKFQQKYGWKPSFTLETKINNGSACRMEALTFTKNDWTYFPDADELVTWDLPFIRKLLPKADQITCDFVHSHDEKGNPHHIAKITKLFRKSMSRIEGRVHDVLIPAGRVVYTNKMRIDHWQKVRPRTEVLPILEYSVAKDNDQRSKFYLGREYYYYKEYKKALTLFDEYLKDAWWQPEITHARYYKAKCFWHTMEGDKARKECLEAVQLNPDFKEALYLMSEIHFEPWKSKWKYIADNAKNTDVLF